MALKLTLDAVRAALRPVLGSAVVDGTDLCARTADELRTFAPYRDTLEGLAKRLEDVLFDALYDAAGENMTIRLDDGSTRRIRMRDLPAVADEAMGAMFDGMEVYSVSYAKLKDYAMRAGSLSAMRVLVQRYAAFQSDEERAVQLRIIRENFPKERYEHWLEATPTETKYSETQPSEENP